MMMQAKKEVRNHKRLQKHSVPMSGFTSHHLKIKTASAA